MKDNKWKKFEELVTEVQKNLSPDAIVKHNDFMIGNRSGRKRQIDVSIKQKIGQYNILIIIDCKDYTEPVDLNDIESFIGLVEDVQANKGAIVSASGFTSGAKKRAEDVGIGLYRLVDTGRHAWQAFVSIPMLCDFRKPIFNFKFASTIYGPFKLPNPQIYDFSKLTVYNNEDKPMGKVIELFVKAWNTGKLSDQIGEHKDVVFTDEISKIEVNGNLFFVRITTNYYIENRLFFGELPIKEISGFSDEIKGGIIAKEFTTGYLDFKEVGTNWKPIKSIKDLAVKPVAIFMALDVLKI